MEKKEKVMLDVDGVIADFVGEFRAYAGLPRYWYPHVYDLHEDAGVLEHGMKWWRKYPRIGEFSEREYVNRILEKMKTVRNFWLTLRAHAWRTELWAMFQVFNVFFITSRFQTRGWSVHRQTRTWLSVHFPGLGPFQIIVTEDKARFCASHNITFALEDSPFVARKLMEEGVNAYLIDRPYNQDETDIPHTSSVRKFGEIVETNLESQNGDCDVEKPRVFRRVYGHPHITPESRENERGLFSRLRELRERECNEHDT